MAEEDWLPIADRLIRRFEGCRLKAYPDPATNADPWTIGWGTTGADVKKGVIWTQAQCDARLLHELLAVYGPAVARLIGKNPTTPHQKAALVSFCYNLGASNLGTSTLLRLHNGGNHQAAADQFRRWNKAAGKVLAGLTKRREAERAVYLGGDA